MTRTINVSMSDSANFPAGEYALYVLTGGHRPGVLSGAELKGKARKYSTWYSIKRASVAKWVRATFAVTSECHRDKHNARLWTDDVSGETVRFVVSQ